MKIFLSTNRKEPERCLMVPAQESIYNPSAFSFLTNNNQKTSECVCDKPEADVCRENYKAQINVSRFIYIIENAGFIFHKKPQVFF